MNNYLLISRLYTTSSRGSNIGSAFLKSTHPSYNQVYANNMDDNSFIGTSKGISRILSESKSVFMNVEDLIMDTKAYQECEIEPIPWKQTLGYVSMAVSKDSPLKKFMDLVILDIMESGSLEQSRLKWSIKKADCQTGVRPISPQKVIMTFIGISAGMVFALVAFFIEKMTWKIFRRRKI